MPTSSPARRTITSFFVSLNTFIPQMNYRAVGVLRQLNPSPSEVRALSLFQENEVESGSLEIYGQDLTALPLRFSVPQPL